MLNEDFQTYLNRAMRLTLPETYRAQTQHLQVSPKFQFTPEQGFEPVPFPGYTIVSPPGNEDPANTSFYQKLADYQAEITQTLGANVLVALPPTSFHFTAADLIWDSAFRHAIADDTYETQLQTRVKQIFEQNQMLATGQPIQFQIIGLMVMARGIAVCLAPVDSTAYEYLYKFRRAVYQNPDLMGLGIEPRAPFTPHITLGYFGHLPEGAQLTELGDRFIKLNQQGLNREWPAFSMPQAELRKFDDMTAFYRAADWPIFRF